jgi:CTP synthase|tara:strand:+ start:3501 stop:5180 length:1680 start_codon:yes stop_codon:yes gene_type:complete
MATKNHKYIFVIGGVMSGVGKGIASSSIGKVLQAKGFSMNLVKVDPYLNVDAGTMNPTEHGETFVLESGLECDQDMGNYERFLNRNLSNEDYITSGMVYQHVIEQERNLKYGGKCVEAIPHIRDEITRRIKKAAEHNGSTISVIEIGGTIGDYQNIMFIEAARVMKVENPDDVIFIMVSYLPIPSKVGEMKTKPTQNAVRSLNSYGVQPNMIMARSEVALDERRKEKIAISCNVRPEHVISAPDIESIYEVPLNFEKDKLSDMLLDLLKVKDGKQSADLAKWKAFVGNLKGLTDEVNIAIVGKYFDTGDFVLSDAYISVIEAIKFSSYESGVKPVIHWVNAKDFESGKKKLSELGDYDGIIVPGGFGETGIEGKVSVIQYARENKIPYFGLCYGMQLAVIEYGRNVLGMDGAHTREIEKDATVPVIDIMESQKKNIEEEKYGGTMRLGAYPAVLKEGTIAREAYLSAGALAKEDGESEISERHRHRYEVNPEYIKQFEDGGLVFSGTSPDGILMEIAELPKEKHPFFLGTQFHPEFHARPLDPHPLFTAFIKAAISGKK